MAKVVLVNPGGRDQVYQYLGAELTAIEPPLWCRLIAGYLKDRGIDVSIIDSEAEKFGPEEIAVCVEDLAPKLVVIVVFGHQPSASTQQMVGAGQAARALKAKNPDRLILIVGGHVAALPERTLREEAVDFACNGEGPITTFELLRELDAPDPDLAEVSGLVYWDNDLIQQAAPSPLITDLDSDLHGDVWDLLPIEKYRAHNWQCFDDLSARQPYASIYTSLGCPYKCVFCCINAPFGANRYRMRKPERVVEEIRHLYDTYGVRTIKIIDEMFVLNDHHVNSICDLLIEQGLDLNIWAYARIDTVKPEILQKLNRAGFKWLALGIESGSKHVRDGADKSFDDEEIATIIRQIQAAGINVIGNFIFGLPDDCHISMQRTLDLAQELNCEFANFYSAMAYPGSPLYKISLENGSTLPDDWSGYSQHSYECAPLPTEKLTAVEVLEFRDRAFDAYFGNPRYLDMLTQRFGWESRVHIQEMTKHKLRRKLLENHPNAAA